jgi:pimeloyl-ACP methyl ester carboxylesterase
MMPGRRRFLRIAAATVAGVAAGTHGVGAQTTRARTRIVDTSALRITFEESGEAAGFPVVLLHGFPDDVRAWDEVVPALVQAGCRTIVPYLRGFGPTHFRQPSSMRSGQQAAIGQDLLDLADALQLPRFAVAGFDWGNRAACIAAALHPRRVRAGVFIHGYTIQDTLSPLQPAAPERERALWYQWYFNTERGRRGLQQNRRALCRLLWETWSPTWHFAGETFDRTAPSFDNPDFVDVVIHSYRHRNGSAQGDPRFADMEQELSRRPRIDVPAIVMHGGADGVAGSPSAEAGERALFSALMDRRVIDGTGHFLPRERPAAVSSALLQLLENTR